MYGMKPVLIGRGLAGWHTDNVGKTFSVSGGATCSITGRSSGGTLEDYLAEAEDGVLVYDADAADVDAFSHLVITGPMVKANLPAGTLRKFGDTATLKRMLGGLEGDFHTLGVATLEGITSLDSVAPDVWVQLLKERVPGVRVGKVVKHQVVWE